MDVLARILVGVDGTEWGFGARRQALLLAPVETSTVHAITALDTAPAIHTGIRAAHFAELLQQEAAEARAAAESIIDGRRGAGAHVLHGKPVEVLRHERNELNATLVALGGRRSSRVLRIMLGDTGTELLHDAPRPSCARTCRAVARGRPRRGRFARSPRPTRNRQRQRARRSPSALHRAHRSRAGTSLDRSAA